MARAESVKKYSVEAMLESLTNRYNFLYFV